jgi:hypothetical protein
MSAYVSNKEKLIAELQAGVFRRIEFLKASKYFISQNGRVLSLNSGEPKELDLRLNAARIAIIILYTPKLRSFNVASLILKVFNGEPKDNSLVPEYIDGDPENLNLSNLRWGESDNTITNETAKSIALASQLINSRNDVFASESHVVNMALRNEILNALLQMLRVAINKTLEKNDIHSLTLFTNEISRIINSNIIVNDRFHKAVPDNLLDTELSKIVMELKNNVETNISLYRGGCK